MIRLQWVNLKAMEAVVSCQTASFCELSSELWTSQMQVWKFNTTFFEKSEKIVSHNVAEFLRICSFHGCWEVHTLVCFLWHPRGWCFPSHFLRIDVYKPLVDLIVVNLSRSLPYMQVWKVLSSMLFHNCCNHSCCDINCATAAQIWISWILH